MPPVLSYRISIHDSSTLAEGKIEPQEKSLGADNKAYTTPASAIAEADPEPGSR